MTTEALLKAKIVQGPRREAGGYEEAFVNVLARCLELGGFAPEEAVERARMIRAGCEVAEFIPCQDGVREEL